MARPIRELLRFDLTPIVESMGMEWVIEQLGGAQRVIEGLGAQRVIHELGGMKQLWAKLTPEQRRQLKRLLQE